MSKRVLFIVSIVLLTYLLYITKYEDDTIPKNDNIHFNIGSENVVVKTQTSNLYMKNEENSNVGVLFTIESNKSYVGERDPYELAIVLDRSGSMSGKIENAKQAIINIINQMIDGDIIHVIEYDDVSSVVWKNGELKDKKEIIKAVRKIQTRGGTNLWSGLELGYSQITSKYNNHKKTKHSRIFLFSDGLVNVGVTARHVMTGYIKKWRKKDDITISTFGIGYGFDKDLMDNIADVGRGDAFFIGEASDIQKVTDIARKDAETIMGTDGKLILKTVNTSNIDITMNLFGRDIIKDNYEYNVIDIRDIRIGDKKFATIELNIDIEGTIEDEYIDLIEWELQYNNVPSGIRNILKGKVGINLINNDKSGQQLMNNNENTEVIVNVDLNRLRVMEEDALEDIKNGDYDDGIKKRKEFEAKSNSYFNSETWDEFEHDSFDSSEMVSNQYRRMNDEKALAFYKDPDKIKNDKQYRRKMLKYHPDKMARNAEQSNYHNEL